jgi:hypothetical protein
LTSLLRVGSVSLYAVLGIAIIDNGETMTPLVLVHLITTMGQKNCSGLNAKLLQVVASESVSVYIVLQMW